MTDSIARQLRSPLTSADRVDRDSVPSSLNSVAELRLSEVKGNQSLCQISVENVLRALDVHSLTQLRQVCRSTAGIVGQALQSDFQLQMNQILFFRQRHCKRFERHMFILENWHLERILYWVLCEFVLGPMCVVLYLDYRAVPAWVMVLPFLLAFVPIFLSSGLGQVPYSGHTILQRHESTLWTLTASELFAPSDRQFLRLWAASFSLAPLLTGLDVIFWPEQSWRPYATLVPSAIAFAIPITLRYLQTREFRVMYTQLALSLWIFTTLAMTWLAIVDIDRMSDTFMSVQMSRTLASLWSFGMLILFVLTIAFPVVFTVVNFSRGWTTIAACGMCATGLEATVLCFLFMHWEHQHWRSWCFLAWVFLAGVIGCVRLLCVRCTRTMKFAEPWLTYCAQRSELFTLPPLLPPAVSQSSLASMRRGGGVLPQ